jgi:histidinol phosphatase-like PHP family hydrolase
MKVSTYLDIFQEVKEKHLENFVDILLGIELDVKPTAKGLVVAAESDLYRANMDRRRENPFEEKDPKILSKFDVITCSIHYAYLGDTASNTEEYVEVYKAGIKAIGDLKERVEQDKDARPVFILSHPWKMAYDIRRSREVEIAFWDESQVRSLAKLLFDKGVMLEFNSACCNSGESDVRKKEPKPAVSLMEAYIDHCRRRETEAYISISSDGHRIDDVGRLETFALTDRVPNIGEARILFDLS